jgi:hypothetical protein
MYSQIEGLHPTPDILRHFITKKYQQWCVDNRKMLDPVGYANWHNRYLSLSDQCTREVHVNKFFDLSEEEYSIKLTPFKTEENGSKYRAV